MTRSVNAPRRRGGLAIAAAAVALTASACSFLNPATAIHPYVAADGTTASIDLGDDRTVTLRNTLIVTGEDGGPGRLIGAVALSGGDPTTVSISTEDGAAASGSDVRVDVTPDDLTLLDPDNTDVVFDGLDAKPGTWVKLTASVPAGGSVTWNVPVLLDEGPFTDLAPAATASPTESGSPTASPTETPTSGATTSPTTTPTETPTSGATTSATTSPTETASP